MKKRILALVLTVALVMGLLCTSASAQADFPENAEEEVVFLTDFPALAEKYGVEEDAVHKSFPKGIPEFLSDEQVQTALKGIGVQVEYGNAVYTFNADDWFSHQSFDVSYETDTAYLAEKYGVRKDLFPKYFPEGVPDFLTDEQVLTILEGTPMSFDVGDAGYHFNVGKGLVAPEAVVSADYADLTKDQHFTANYGYADYTAGNSHTANKQMSVTYKLKEQDPSANRKGRAWCAMQLPNGGNPKAVQGTSESQNIFGNVKASCVASMSTFTYIEYPIYVHFSYRNLNTDTKIANMQIFNNR